jgi:hypothetical protein
VPPGVDVGASGTITVDATTTAAVRPGGADTACTDRRTGPAVSPLDGAPAARGAFRLTLLPFAGPRPRCPAPLDDPLGPHTTLTTTLAGGAVGARRLVLRFRRPVTGTVPGFRVTTRPDLTIVLERARVSEQVSPPLPRLAMRLRPRPGRPTSVRPPRSGAAWSRTLPRP